MGAFKASTNCLSLGGIQRNDWYATQVKHSIRIAILGSLALKF